MHVTFGPNTVIPIERACRVVRPTELPPLRIGFLNARGAVAHDRGRTAAHAFADRTGLHALCMSETWTFGHDLRDSNSIFEHARGHELPREDGAVRARLGMNALHSGYGGWTWHHMAEFNTDYTQWLKASTTTPDAEGRHTHVYVGSVYVPGRYVARHRTGNAQQQPQDSNAQRNIAWQQLDRTCAMLHDSTSRDPTARHVLIVGGDLNGRLAMNGDETANAAGEEIRDFADRHDLTIANGLAVAHGTHSFTRAATPDRGAANSTPDFVLIDTACEAHVTKLRICDDSGIDSDHKPVVMELWLPSPKPNDEAAPHVAPHVVPRAAPHAAPLRSAMRDDNAELKQSLDRGMEQWLATAAPTTCTGDGIDALEMTFAHALQSCAVTSADTTQRKRPTRGGARGAVDMRARVTRAIRNAADRLAALIRHGAAAAVIAEQKLRLRRLQGRRQAAIRREQLRCNRRDEELFRSGDEATVWDRLQTALALSRRRRARGTAKAIGAVMDADGRLVTEPKAIAQVFREHFQREGAAAVQHQTANADVERLHSTAANPLTRDTTNLRTPATEQEIQRHIQQMKRRKAPGPDGTYPELLKMKSAALLRAITALCNAVLRTGVWPTRWGTGNVVPIPKAGGDRLKAGDYRGISLLPVISKLLEAVLNARLMAWLEATNGLHDAQHGFRPGRSTLDAAFVLHELVAAAKETATHSRRTAAQRRGIVPPAAHHTIYIAYLDVRKAYDGCWRQGIIAQLKARGVDQHTCALFESMLQPGKVRRTALIGTARSDEFALESGVPQGAVLSPALYNVFIDGLARRLEADERGFGATAHGIRVPSLLYADDIALLAHSPHQLQQMVDVCTQYAAEWRFSFNAAKCVVQIAGRDTKALTALLTIAETAMDGVTTRRVMQRVDRFKYLGLQPDFAQRPDTNARWAVQMAAHTAAAQHAKRQILAGARRFSWMSPAMLMRLFITYAAPKAEYGVQLWGPFLCARQRDELDRIQTQLQMRALLPNANAASPMPHAFANGEFARVSLALHGDELALRYLHHLTHAPPNTTLRRVFDARMGAARQRHNTPRDQRAARDGGTQSWCTALYSVCERVGMTSAWDGTEPVTPDAALWRSKCRAAVRAHWTHTWRQRTARHKALDGVYDATRVPKPQPYLFAASTATAGREILAQIRCNALPLGAVRADLMRRTRRAAGLSAAAPAAVPQRTPSDAEPPPNACGGESKAENTAQHNTNAPNASHASEGDAELTRAEQCDECALRGVHTTDTAQHFIAECDAQRFGALTRLIGAALHRIGHAMSPNTRQHCPDASAPHAHTADARADAQVSDRCDGHVMESNWLRATAEQRVRACLNGFGGWTLRKTTVVTALSERTTSHSANRQITRAIVRCTLNFLALRWKNRAKLLGHVPVIAFGESGARCVVAQPLRTAPAPPPVLQTSPLQPSSPSSLRTGPRQRWKEAQERLIHPVTPIQFLF